MDKFKLHHHYVLVLFGSLYVALTGALQDDFLPSGVFRDDILFDLSWPGDKDPATSTTFNPDAHPSKVEEETGTSERLEGVNDGKLLGVGERVIGEMDILKGISNKLLPEVDYLEPSYVDMATGTREKYRCIIPSILKWEEEEEVKETNIEE